MEKEEGLPTTADFIETPLDAPCTISVIRSIRDTRPQNQTLTYADFYARLLTPDFRSFEKFGLAYLIGPTDGTRLKSGLEYGSVAVIDGDSHLNENKQPESGAPDVVAVHEALKKENISHCIHTTHSHLQEDNGPRWRAAIPIRLNNEQELFSVLMAVVNLVNTKHGLNLYLTPESYRWSQVWQFPRVAKRDAPFFSAWHHGVVPSVAYATKHYPVPEKVDTAAVVVADQALREDTGSLSWYISQYLPIGRQLSEAGYEYVGQSLMRGEGGKLMPVQRWSYPGASNPGGVVVFRHDHADILYSHHSHDPLAVGRGLRALDVFQLLNGFSETDAMQFALHAAEPYKIAELDLRYPTIMAAGNEFRVGNLYDEVDGEVSHKLMTWGNFQLSVANEPPIWVFERNGENDNAQVAAKTIDAYWRTCRQRTHFNGLVYEPFPITQKPSYKVKKANGLYYNLFRGWPTLPKKGTLDRLAWHLLHGICGSNEEQYEYLLDWWAHLLQNPEEKPGVALVLKSGKGTGKSKVFGALVSALGSHGIVLTNSEQLTGKFNAHLANKLAVMLEESFWSGNPLSEGTLKTLITDREATYEQKGLTPVRGKSYCRVILITNNSWAAPVTDDERRFFIPDVSNASLLVNETTQYDSRGDFFPFLFREMHNGGIEAFFYDMAQRDLSGRNIHAAPKTGELTNQFLETLSREDAWLYDILNVGQINFKGGRVMMTSPTGTTVNVDDLHESIKEYISYHEKKHGVHKKINRILGKWIPKCHHSFMSAGGTMYRFANLADCRREYESNARLPVKWDHALPGDGRDDFYN